MATNEIIEPDNRTQRKQDFLMLTDMEPKELYGDYQLLAGAIIDNPAGFAIEGSVLRVEQTGNGIDVVYLAPPCVEGWCDCSWQRTDFMRRIVADSLERGSVSYTSVSGVTYTEVPAEVALEDVERNPADCEDVEFFETEWVAVFLPINR
jgi:hypothetical protein